jgi:hypothetical protein
MVERITPLTRVLRQGGSLQTRRFVLQFKFCSGCQFCDPKSPTSCSCNPMERNPFYGKLLRSSSSRPFPRLCIPSVELNPISLTNADCVHHAFEEIGLVKKSFLFSEINFPKIIFFLRTSSSATFVGNFK